ncbi:MAG: LysR family transcriptional regulator [Corallococcus sp.]|nr:LysR family transcriptional regulator [Corallococcus sp.]
MNYEYYKIFYCVGKHKNITRAADELYSSQPAVTRVIQNMETELGCRLFIRNKKGVEFTHEGQILFAYVSVACEQFRKAEEELTQAVSLDGGIVYIGATVTALHCFLFDFLDGFRSKYPNVRFKIRTNSSDNTIEYLKNGTVDLAFVTTPYNAPKPLHVTKIREFKDVLIAGSNYTQLQNKRLHFDDLSNYPFVSLAKGMQLRQFVDDIFAAHNADITPDVEVDGVDLIVPMVKHNRGLSLVPEGIVAEALKRGEVFEMNFAEKLPPRFVCMISDPRHTQSSASRELQRMIQTDLNGL